MKLPLLLPFATAIATVIAIEIANTIVTDLAVALPLPFAIATIIAHLPFLSLATFKSKGESSPIHCVAMISMDRGDMMDKRF